MANAELMEIKKMKDRASSILVELGKIEESDVMKKYVETKTLKVELTKDEIIEASEVLTEALNDLDALTNELDSLKQQIKSRVKEVEAKAEQARQKIHDKYEYRKVDCVEIKNNTNGFVLVVRMDDDTLVSERAMTADERQGKLWDETPEEEVEDEYEDTEE